MLVKLAGADFKAWVNISDHISTVHYLPNGSL